MEPIAALDPHVCQQARLSRDVRFDGLFFTGVKTTGIFCRPICSAVPPKEENVTYYLSAGAAIAEGFRPCLRCRPETAPQSAAWLGIEAVAGKILRYIDQGYLIEHSVPELAESIGISERYLRQLCQRYAGANPSQIELARKSLFAKQLVFDSSLSITDIAFASGYNSVRRFNEHWLQQFGKAPSEMRSKRRAFQQCNPGCNQDGSWINLRIPVIEGFDADSIFSFLATRIISGSEAIITHKAKKNSERVTLEYQRVLQLDVQLILLAVSYDEKNACLLVSFKKIENGSIGQKSIGDEVNALKLLPRIFQLVKQVFDVETNAQVILSHLKNSDEFAKQLATRERNGLQDIRLPAAFDPFEAAMRAIVGQQVSVKAACTLLTRLCERCGTTVADNEWQLIRTLPNAQSIVDNDLSGLGLTGARINSLKAMALLRISEPEVFSFGYDNEVRRKKLLAIKGIGSWTVSYLEMRAFSNPDAFPAGDLGVRVALEKQYVRPTEKQVYELSKPWAPWRAYATVLLWQRLI